MLVLTTEQGRGTRGRLQTFTSFLALNHPLRPCPSLCPGCAVLSLFGHVWLFATVWTAAHQVPVHGFSRQEHWSGLPCPPPGHLPNTATEPTSLTSLALAGTFFYHQHHLGSLLSGFTCPKYKLLTPRLSNLSTGRMGWGRTQGVPPLHIQGFCLAPLCSLPSRLEPSMCASSSIWAACSSWSPSWEHLGFFSPLLCSFSYSSRLLSFAGVSIHLPFVSVGLPIFTLLQPF